MQNPDEIKTEAAEMKPRGKAAFMEMYKSRNPDMTDEPDDDTLFDYGARGYRERDEYEGKYNTLNGANEKLAAIIGEDPRFAQFISMVANGENLMYALGKTFGNLVDQLDEGSLEELRKGQEEYKGRFETVKNNFSNYEKNLKQYAEANSLTPEEVERIDNTIMDIAEAFADRDIPAELIDLIYKGADYDNQRTAEVEAAKLAGKNEAINQVKSRKAEASPMPDMAAAAAGTKPRKPVSYSPRIESMTDAFKEKDV